LTSGNDSELTVRMRNGTTVVLSRAQAEALIERLTDNSSYIGSLPMAAQLRAELDVSRRGRQRTIEVTTFEESALRRVLE
jgi:hypothetical protein